MRGAISRLTEHRAFFAAIIVVIVLAVGGLFDFVANNGKAYGGVTVGGLDVGGLNEEEIAQKLEQTFGKRLDASVITLKGKAQEPGDSEDAPAETTDESASDEDVWSDEEAWFEDAAEDVQQEWMATKASTGASLAYDAAAAAALAVGRDDGGFLARFGLFFGPRDVPFSVDFDDAALEGLLSEIDAAIGDPRTDATVVVEEGVARGVEGHDGSIIDRKLVSEELSTRMMSEDLNVSTLEVEPTEALSRVTFEQAQEAADIVNRAIENGVVFAYEASRWDASRADVGSWVEAQTIEDNGKYGIYLGINQDSATDALIGNLDASVTTDDVQITFEKGAEGMLVHTHGSTPIPDMPAAITELEVALFGEQGTGYTGGSAPVIEVRKSDAPETLTFAQACDLGIVTALAEYTTEYSNDEGVQNRNHNIHLVSDTLNDSIIEADGGYWSFNETSGDTNQDPPYASAGSIINGEYVDSIGGGICQVATTVFNAAYEAGIDIPVRFNHTLYLSNYPDGRDASVSYPELDLQLSNPLDSDVLLKVTYTDTTVTAAIYGVAAGYVVTTEPGVWEEGAKYSTTFEHDDTLSEGMYYLKSYGSDGSKYSVTRTVKDAEGNLVSVKTFASVYQAKNEVYVVGPGVDTSKLERDTSDDDDAASAYASGADTSGWYWQDDSTTGTTDLYGYDTGYGDGGYAYETAA